jgi:hypothetical protein
LLGGLVLALDLLHELEGPQTGDDSTEDHIFTIHEGERATGCHVELTFIGICIIVPVAHSHEAWLIMLNGKAFIVEFTLVIDRIRLIIFID